MPSCHRWVLFSAIRKHLNSGKRWHGQFSRWLDCISLLSTEVVPLSLTNVYSLTSTGEP